MRRGEQSMPTIRGVEEEVRRINDSGILPPGVSIKPIYDRTDLISVTTRTVLENMLVGMVLIFLVQWLFLGDLRSAGIVAATIPFALLFAVSILMLRGESANLLSVGAIDFGLVVDATVIMMENIFRHLSGDLVARGERQARRAKAEAAGLPGKLAVILVAAQEVGQPILFSAAIIVAAFVPLFTMSGVEGHIFGPMARTYAYAIAGGVIATFTISPVLAAFLLPERTQEKEGRLLSFLHSRYLELSRWALANRLLSLGAAGTLLGFAFLSALALGMEFLPHLEEGNLWIRATMPATISLESANSYVNRMRRVIGTYPEVMTAVSQNGRPDDGTDASGFFNAEFFVPLKPASQWPSGVSKERLTDTMSRALTRQFPGVEFNFSQTIEDNVEEAASGVKGENSVKLFGSNLATLESTAAAIKAVMAKVPGIADLAVLNSLGQPTIEIRVDRLRAARFGLATGDINAVIQAAVGGQAAGNLYEPNSDRNYPIIVRLAPQYRDSLEAIRHLVIHASSPSGGAPIPVPLSEIADIRLVSGAAFIYREHQERYIPIKFSVRGRDLGSAVREVQERIQKQVRMPAGYSLEWVGEFGQLQEALGRLAVAIPISLALIGMLLYINFSSLRDTLLAASVMPMAAIGGIMALYMTGTAFSVSAAIGFIALFGISVMNGIIVLAFYNRLLATGVDRGQAISRTCEVQFRPVMMTCVAACVGLLPAALSTGIGSQVQKPLALVVVGGMLLAPALILLVLPVLIDRFSIRQPAQVAP
jgi:cobalt-zinc-cadmium resistance protein CzcA